MGTYNLGDATYGLDLTGATPNGAALNAAWARIPAGSKVYQPYIGSGQGVQLDQTVIMSPNSQLYGDGSQVPAYWRNSDYGSTFKIGDEVSVPAGGAVIEDLYIQQGSYYVQGATNLKAVDGTTAMKSTSGSHFEIHGSQNPVVKNCRLSRMPYGIYFYGGSGYHVEDNVILGVWDQLNIGCQEGIAQIVYDVSTKWGNPQLTKHYGNQLCGPQSAARTVTFPYGVTKTLTECIGSQFGVLVHGMEDGKFDDYYGGMNSNNVALMCKAGGLITDLKFSCDFDASRLDQFFVQPYDGSSVVHDIYINAGSNFNGQLKGIGAIFVQSVDGVYGHAPSAINFNVNNATFVNHTMTPIRYFGVKGGEINDTRLYNYNCYNTSATDAQQAAAGFITGSSTGVTINNCKTGGNQQLDASRSGGNHCELTWVGGTVTNNTHIAPV